MLLTTLSVTRAPAFYRHRHPTSTRLTLSPLPLADLNTTLAANRLTAPHNTILASVATALSAAALRINCMRTAKSFLGNFVAARLGKPAIVRETTRIMLFIALRQFGSI